MRAQFGLLTVVNLISATAQYWSDAGMQIDAVGEIGRFYVDSANNKLYSAGIWVEGMGQPDQSLRYTVLNGTEWSLSVPLDNLPWSIVNYHDTLFMGGDFTGSMA